MMLRRLVEYDHAHGDRLPTGYRALQVHWQLQLTVEGKFRQLLPTFAEGSNPAKGRTRPAPDCKRSGTAPAASIFTDLATYVLGKGSDGKDAGAYHSRYLNLARACADELQEPACLVALRFLEEVEPDDARFVEVLPQHRILPVVGDQVVTDLPTVQEFWARRVRQSTSSRAPTPEEMQCLVTGELCQPVRIFAQKVVGVPNTNQGKADLISFNNDSFLSFGQKQTLSAPISPEAADSIVRALNSLIANPRTCKRMGDSVFLAWCRSSTEFDFWDIIDAANPVAVKKLLEGVAKGEHHDWVSSADFYVLALTGSNARIIVRDYIETTLTSLKESISTWFSRMELPGLGSATLAPVGLARLADSLYVDGKQPPSSVRTALFRAAMTGQPLPTYLLGLAVKRNLAMQGPFYEGPGKSRLLDTNRLALIKAVLTPDINENIMTKQSDTLDKHAFACGRMLAVLDSIFVHFINVDTPKGSKWKRPKVNVSTRYYGAACGSPASVFGRLIDNSRPHLSKLRAAGKDFGYELKLEEIAQVLDREFPKTLDVRRQGIFALGYYHQTASDRAARANSGIAEEETTTEENPA